MSEAAERPLGAVHLGKGKTLFRVWAPFAKKVAVELGRGASRRREDLFAQGKGYFAALVEKVSPGTPYLYSLDGKPGRPDPASRLQLNTVHGPSVVTDASFRWTDRKWKGLPVSDYVIYEIHVGTFTDAGTFEAVIPFLPYLKGLGITCLELMPVAQFPGKRNWGYDGVGLYAVQNSYGGPQGLKKLVNACHLAGIAVCLDVVYNHFGPEGNYLYEYGPYFTKRYHTPWGDALNYDDAGCDEVRSFMIGNALYWVSEYGIDALRLDAVHSIFDQGARHFLADLQEQVQKRSAQLKRQVNVIAESDLNDGRLVRPARQGGFDLDGQWSDDFHHAAHAYLTGERLGYYEDFGGLAHLGAALKKTFVYDGCYSNFRGRSHGNSVTDLDGSKFVTCTQNHDQIGNRGIGDRLSVTLSFEEQKIAAALLLFSPYVPLLFMGQEYGETAPFQYFVDHGDPGLLEAVRRGRQKEFASFGWKDLPDPGAVATFKRSRPDWKLRKKGRHAALLSLHKDLFALRKRLKIGTVRTRKDLSVKFSEKDAWLSMAYRGGGKRVGIFFSFRPDKRGVRWPWSGAKFKPLLWTEDKAYGGTAEKGFTAGGAPRDEIDFTGVVAGILEERKQQ